MFLCKDMQPDIIECSMHDFFGKFITYFRATVFVVFFERAWRLMQIM